MRIVPPIAFPNPLDPNKFRDALDGQYPGSFVPAEFFNAVNAELNAIISTAGAAAQLDLQQLLKAVRAQRMNYFTATGTANALTIAPTPVFPAWAEVIGAPLNILVASTNTGPATLAITGLAGTVPILRPSGGPLLAGDLRAGTIVRLMYDGYSALLPGLPSGQSMTNVRFTTVGSNSWVVPAGVYEFEGQGWSGGGGAGYNQSASTSAVPSGGGSGAWGWKKFSCAPGQTVTVVVGAPGIGGYSLPAPGQPGGSTSITCNGVIASLTGGGGGLNTTTAGQMANAPAGGAATGWDISIDGSPGFIGTPAAAAFGGYGGAAPRGGPGGAGGYGTPGPGVPPGAGGGATSSSAYAGGYGARGEALITYRTP